MLSNFEMALEEKDKTESRDYVNEYVSNFLNNDPFPGIEYEGELVNRFVPDITLDEVNQMAYFIGKPNNLIALITAPEKEDVTVPTVEDVLATIEAASAKQPETYKEEVVQTSLIQNPLTGGAVVKTTTNEDFGTTELLLNNGVRVVLKPTDFKNDEILMTSYGFGGTSLASDEDFISASFANQIVAMSGIGNFSHVELSKFLTGKNVSVNPEIGNISQGLSGKAVKKDLKTMLELSYLYFTEPRKDTTAFQTFKAQMLAQFKFMMANPQAVFYDTIFKLATQNDPRTLVIPTEAQINSIDLETAYSFYKDRFANANGFVFVFVGNFNVDSITPQLAKYLGSIPWKGDVETWKDVNPEFPAGITEATVYRGTEPKSSVALMMDQSFEWDVESRLGMNILMKILNIRMRESMREDQGGVYGVQARPTMTKYPKEEVNIMVAWGCAPENVEQLVNTVFAEMDTLKMNGPESVNLGKARETVLRDYQTNFEENSYWLGKIKNSFYYDEELLSLDQLNKIVEGITPAYLQKMATTYFTDDHYLKVILMPEEGTTEE
jgi:zinc protease